MDCSKLNEIFNCDGPEWIDVDDTPIISPVWNRLGEKHTEETKELMRQSNKGVSQDCRDAQKKRREENPWPVWNSKEVFLFGEKYKTIRDACKSNNITYNQYKVLIDEDLPINNGEELKTFIWERRNKRVSKGMGGNINKKGWKSNPITYMRQSDGIKKALNNRINKRKVLI